MTSQELMEFLGYEDLRSLKKWCEANEVPLIKVGLRYLAHSWTVEIALLRILQVEANSYGIDGQDLINALANDNKLRVAHLLSAPVTQDEEESFVQKDLKSSSCDDLIEEFKNKSA